MRLVSSNTQSVSPAGFGDATHHYHQTTCAQAWLCRGSQRAAVGRLPNPLVSRVAPRSGKDRVVLRTREVARPTRVGAKFRRKSMYLTNAAHKRRSFR